MTSLDPISGDLRLIEVKGLAARTGTIVLTLNERRVAEDRPDCYWLYLVTDCATDPLLRDPVPNPARGPWVEVRKVQHYTLNVEELTKNDGWPSRFNRPSAALRSGRRFAWGAPVVHQVRSIQSLLNEIRRGNILLPEFQRGYVWNRNQVRGLMQSLYRRHPTGHVLTWRTHKPSLVRGGEALRDGHSLLLLDGQQRLTSLYVLFQGKAPPFYEGEDLFFNLYFNVQTEEFRFWQKMRMANNPAWIGVHEFLRQGLNDVQERLGDLDEEKQAVFQRNLARLSSSSLRRRRPT